jgi:hypothetical protein
MDFRLVIERSRDMDFRLVIERSRDMDFGLLYKLMGINLLNTSANFIKRPQAISLGLHKQN